jgi:hypothetical protein
MVEWLALLLHIQDVLGSNLGPETRYLTEVSCFYWQYLQANVRIAHLSVTANKIFLPLPQTEALPLSYSGSFY